MLKVDAAILYEDVDVDVAVDADVDAVILFEDVIRCFLNVIFFLVFSFPFFTFPPFVQNYYVLSEFK